MEDQRSIVGQEDEEPGGEQGHREFFVRIPRHLTPEQAVIVNAGGPYPVIESDYLPKHEVFVEFLIDRSLDAWTRSQG